MLALDEAHLRVRTGTVHALLGENGAGKTTLMRMAFGMLTPDSGSIRVNDTIMNLHSPADAIAVGIGMVHQHFTNVPAMTVAENVALGKDGSYDRRLAEERVRQVCAVTGLVLDPQARAADLPVGAQQRLEIVKALSRNAHILILDEPTAVLAPAEARELLAWLRTFADEGRTVVLITHKLAEALDVADDVTVLRRGRTVLSGAASSLTVDQLAHAMLGGDLATEPAAVSAVAGEVRIRAERIHIAGADGIEHISDASFEICAGEIVGIAAVEGAGQAHLLRAIAGRQAVSRGALRIPATVGFVPEDRQRDGLVMGFTLTENVALRGSGLRRGRMNWPRWTSTTDALLRDFDVRAPGSTARAQTLSGGNQQKLVLARELAGPPGALVAENPTRGLDVRAAASVHARLHAAAREGVAVVLYSADLDEVIALSSRILVVHAGRVSELGSDRDLVGRAMLGLG